MSARRQKATLSNGSIQHGKVAPCQPWDNCGVQPCLLHLHAQLPYFCHHVCRESKEQSMTTIHAIESLPSRFADVCLEIFVVGLLGQEEHVGCQVSAHGLPRRCNRREALWRVSVLGGRLVGHGKEVLCAVVWWSNGTTMNIDCGPMFMTCPPMPVDCCLARPQHVSCSFTVRCLLREAHGLVEPLPIQSLPHSLSLHWQLGINHYLVAKVATSNPTAR